MRVEMNKYEMGQKLQHILGDISSILGGKPASDPPTTENPNLLSDGRILMVMTLCSTLKQTCI